jgi:cyclic beta-1,2-glucan synthetase
MSEEFDESSLGFLETKANELANSHLLSTFNPNLLPSLVVLRNLPEWIKQVKRSLNTADVNTARVAEWIFDNSYLLERALGQIKHDMPSDYYCLLPCLCSENNGELVPRAYRVVSGFLAADGIQIALPILVKFIKAYQKVSPLDISELWALPTFFRLVCIEMVIAIVVQMDPKINSPYKGNKSWQPIEIALDKVDCLGRALHCLANIENISWQSFFEQVNIVEEELRKDPVNVYAKLDFDSRNRYCKAVEHLARTVPFSEQAVAQQAVALASRSTTQDERFSHVGYWLVDEGKLTLETEINYKPSWFERCNRGLQRHSTAFYFVMLMLSMVIFESIAVFYLVQNQAEMSELAAGFLLSLVPVSMVAVALVNWLITIIVPPRILNKIDFDKAIDPHYATAVVIPTLLGSNEEIDNLLAQVERHYLCNSDPALRFVLLTDFLDAATQELPSDSVLIDRTREGVKKLNQKYCSTGKGMFHLLHRPRQYNPGEGCWMGWERKRGKLAAFNCLLCGEAGLVFEAEPEFETGLEFSVQEGDDDSLRNIRFVITLDSDTQLFRGTASRLIGTLAHPLNRAIFDDKSDQIIAGYTIIQPRIEIDPSRSNNTWFSRIASGDRVIDIYSRAVSEVYQDLFGSGIFVGKGIYDLTAFKRSLEGRIPENTVLSHDLLEGILGRTALASDIVLYEVFPSEYLAFLRRLHRWIRGDWQHLPWLGYRTKSSDGRLLKNSLKAIERWKIIDNLRRSLCSPLLLLWFVAGWLWLPGHPLVWTLLALFSPIGHNIVNIMFGLVRSTNLTSLLKTTTEPVATIERWLMFIAFLPHQAITASDAIVRTLFRLTVSRKSLLQWVTAAHIDKSLHKAAQSSHLFWREMIAGVLLTCVITILIISKNPSALPYASPLLLLWLLSPEITRILSRPITVEVERLDKEEIIFLRRLSRRTWLFFETFVDPVDHWLPPDNYQEDPHSVISHRTSPTNIGMMFLANLSAWDFGYLGPTDFAARTLASLNTLATLEHYRGHIFNWYDTRTLEVLPPRYVSTVDSGNLAACLLSLKQGCADIRQTSIFTRARWDGLMDTFSLIEESLLHLTVDDLSVDDQLDDNVDYNALIIQAQSIRHKAWSVLDKADTWWLTVRELNEIDLIEFDRVLVKVLTEKAPVHKVSLVRDVRVWVGRAHQHLRDMLRDMEQLLPWLTVIYCPLATKNQWMATRYHVTLKKLRDLLLPTLSLDDIPPTCLTALQIIADFRIDMPEIDDAEERTAIGLWFNQLEKSIQTSNASARLLQDQLTDIAERADTEVNGMDFRLLFDEDSQLFHIGWNASAAVIDPHHYDLLASEARLASIIAIGKGDVSIKHWFALGRPVTRVSGSTALLSWGGTMFEYLMPRLLLSSADGTLLAESERAAVDQQIILANKRGTPWGISESGYAIVDHQHNYQYKAFGVPSLGFKRGLELDTVIAPYASALALAVYPVQATKNLKQMAELGLLGLYGMYEAADYTTSRQPANRKFALVQSHMAHHQGMIFVALDNALLKDAHVQRFQSDPAFQTVELLLHEKVPVNRLPEFPTDAVTDAEKSAEPQLDLPELPSWKPALYGNFPQLHMIGNGRFSTLISDSGAGGLGWRKNALTRWSPDPTLDNKGLWIYLEDDNNGDIWSAGRQPLGNVRERYEVIFSAHMVEFHRQDFGISLHMDVAVAANDDVEVRRITLNNETNRIRKLTLTSYGEVVLAQPNEDERHPAFSKLFVHSEMAKSMNALIFERRPRNPHESPPALMHRMIAESDAIKLSSFETDREHFIGRNGNLRSPLGIAEGLSETLGWTLDPVMSLQVSVELAPYTSEVLTFITIASGSRRSLFEIANNYETLSSVELIFHDAKSRARRDLQHFQYAIPFLSELQQLLSVLLQSYKGLRAKPSLIAKNSLAQSSLWAFGVSGDLPLLLLRQHEETNLDLLRVLVCAHQRWHQLGLNIDLLILYESPSGYADEINERLQQLMNKLEAQGMLVHRGGIHLLHWDQLSGEQHNLLKAAANVILNDRTPLAQQLASLNQQSDDLPAFVGTMVVPVKQTTAQLKRRTDLTLFNGLGGFSADGHEYVIYLEPHETTPAPWCNVLANDSFGCLTSERGGGYTWAINSGENRLTQWMNDPVEDPPSEIVYLRDEDTAQVWTVTPKPIGTGSLCEITHGAGYTVWRNIWQDLEQELQISVAEEDPVKIIRLRLHNCSEHARRLTVTYYAELTLGVTRHKSSPHIVSEFDPETNAILARNTWNTNFSERVTFLCSNRSVHGYTTDRTEFLGREGDFQHPAGLYRWGFKSVTGAALDPCAALQIYVDVPATGETELFFILGQADNAKQAKQLIKKWQQPQTVSDDWLAMQARWQRVFNSLTVHTPEPAFDIMMNQWLIYQTLACRVFARTGLYQSSGAFGFRDQLQDIMALVHAQPSLARQHILTSAAHQFEMGDVLHWWHPPGDSGVRTHCSDDMLWLPFVTAHYVEVSGDDSILEEEIPFLVGEPLGAQEENRYSRYESTIEKYTVFEHCKRALNIGIRSSGEHGLLTIGGGDWNDGMDRVGAHGRGESIWLSWFAISVIDSFSRINDRTQKNDNSADWLKRAQELAEAIEKNGWDGNWYRRAYDDEGLPWGSAECQECRIDSIAQSWATLSGAGDPLRARQALESAERELTDEKNRILRLLWPAFNATMREPGYIKAYPPGIRENGGQYTHAAAWLAWAHTVQKDGNAAFRILQMLNPIEHSLNPKMIRQYRVEPYVMAADVASIEPHAGRGGWTWYTGSAAWIYRLGMEAILGIRYKGKFVCIDPCIPTSWKGFTATLKRDRATIEVTVENVNGTGHGVIGLIVDGEVKEGNQIEWPQDGEIRHVLVKLGTV